MQQRFDWQESSSFDVPRIYPADGFAADGVRPVFLEGFPYRGRETRIFAWVGMPENVGVEKVPGIVLVHGGGATALDDWVRLWTGRGFAAISMDVCGGVPCASDFPYYCPGGWPRHEHSAPGGWGLELTERPEEYWLFHAVHAVIRSHSYLRSLPQVDASRIGVTGVSWGGVTTCLVAGLDARFRFAAPVYGCGFLGETPHGLGQWDITHKDRWLELWDPATLLPRAQMPFLWVNGTNDFAFPIPSMMRSAQLLGPRSTMSLQVAMPHGHGGPGEKPCEIPIFANHVLHGEPGLAQFIDVTRNGSDIRARIESPVPIVRAELNFTRAIGYWPDRAWSRVEATLNASEKSLSATLPPRTTAWYLNVFDERGVIVSSQVEGLDS